ncbi:MAG: hypothetical protein ACI4KR_04100 [Ruminiclostridium sp.]
MTLNERLERARKGSRRDYDVLCAEAADSLYAIAFLTLKDEKDAEAAVKKAESDGFSGIARINDLPHLKAWLIRELTKISVAKLKEYRAAGITFAAASGVKASVDKLPDIERLVYSISAVCGYTVKELSVITGLQEEAAEKKLASAVKRLGAGEEAVKAAAAAITAPDSLKAAAGSALSDMTAEINRSDDEGMIDEMERISRLAAQAENGEQAEKETAQENSPKPEAEETEAAENGADREEIEEKAEEELPAEEENGEPKLDAATFISVISAEKIKGGEFLRLLGNTRISNAAYREIEHNPNLTKQRLIQLLEESPLTEADYYKLLAAVKQRRELLDARDESRLRQEQAGLFTGRRERPKRKPKEEPKSELAAAIEMETAKEAKAKQEASAENRTSAEKESLSGTKPFEYAIPDYAVENPPKQKEEPPAFTEKEKPDASEPEEKPLAFAAEEPFSPTDKPKEKPLTLTEQAGKSAFSQRKNGAASMILDKPEKQAAPKEESEKTEAEDEAGIDPFAAIGISGLDSDISDSEDEDFISAEDKEEEKPLKAEKTAKKDKTEKTAKAEELPEKEEAEKETTGETQGREKYKNNDFFIDDDEYYPGVNRGKLVFCAVCAVLLIAGSFGIRYMQTGSFLPASDKDKPAVIETIKPEQKREITSYGDIYDIGEKLAYKAPPAEIDRYCTGGEPYAPALSLDVIETENKLYIYGGTSVEIVELDRDNPRFAAKIPVNASADFAGFTLCGETVCLFYNEADSIYAEGYNSDGTAAFSYRQSGKLIGLKAENDRLLIATSYAFPEAADKNSPESFMPKYTLNGKEETADFSSVVIPDRAEYNCFTAVGAVSGASAEISAVLGGYNGFVSFEENGYTLIIPDNNRTFAESYSLTGLRAARETEKEYSGEAFSADCLKNGVFTGFDYSKGSILIANENTSSTCTADCGEGSVPTGLAVSGSDIYAVISSGQEAKLYGFEVSEGAKIKTDINPDSVYTEKLRACGDMLAGLRAEADGNGSRTGLRLSVYSYGESLEEKAYGVIGLDEKTGSEYLRYLSGDAEENPLRIAVNEEGTRLAVTTVYFDGISEIERTVLFGYENGILTEKGNIMLFDLYSKARACAIRGDTLFIVADGTIVTADTESCSPTGYFGAEKPAETEEEAEAVIE